MKDIGIITDPSGIFIKKYLPYGIRLLEFHRDKENMITATAGYESKIMNKIYKNTIERKSSYIIDLQEEFRMKSHARSLFFGIKETLIKDLKRQLKEKNIKLKGYFDCLEYDSYNKQLFKENLDLTNLEEEIKKYKERCLNFYKYYRYGPKDIEREYLKQIKEHNNEQ